MTTMLGDSYAPLKLFGGLGFILGIPITTVATGLVLLFVWFNPWSDDINRNADAERARQAEQVASEVCTAEFLQGRDPREVAACPEYQPN